MQTKVAQAAREGAVLANHITESANGLRADLLALRIEQAIDTAKDRNQHWMGVFPQRDRKNSQFSDELLQRAKQKARQRMNNG